MSQVDANYILSVYGDDIDSALADLVYLYSNAGQGVVVFEQLWSRGAFPGFIRCLEEELANGVASYQRSTGEDVPLRGSLNDVLVSARNWQAQ